MLRRAFRQLRRPPVRESVCRARLHPGGLILPQRFLGQLAPIPQLAWSAGLIPTRGLLLSHLHCLLFVHLQLSPFVGSLAFGLGVMLYA